MFPILLSRAVLFVVSVGSLLKSGLRPGRTSPDSVSFLLRDLKIYMDYTWATSAFTVWATVPLVRMELPLGRHNSILCWAVSLLCARYVCMYDDHRPRKIKFLFWPSG